MIPLSRFKGDYQRIKDELSVVSQNPGVQSQMTVAEIDDISSNLRFLQRTYRVYAANQMVPPAEAKISNVRASMEGFDQVFTQYRIYKKDETEGFRVNIYMNPITPDQLLILSQKLAVEMARLQASGSYDPVLHARIDVYGKIKQTVDTLIEQVKTGTLSPDDIPIKQSDYLNFLPSLGDNSAGIAGLLSKSGYSSLSSLFNAYDMGDIDGSQIAARLLETYMDSLLNGLSYNIGFSYTSPNEVALAQAEAAVALAPGLYKKGLGEEYDSSNYEPVHPLAYGEPRGAFEAQINSLDTATNSGVRPASIMPTEPGKFDWKARAQDICNSVAVMGLNPDDYGCQKNEQVSSEFSWRGYAKMVCNRLATNADPGVPVQAGCPPVSWRGWSS
jgi:hypothetical protein